MQTSPISFVASGKGPFSASKKGNRRRLHAVKLRQGSAKTAKQNKKHILQQFGKRKSQYERLKSTENGSRDAFLIFSCKCYEGSKYMTI